ncbi:MAG: family 10 glycosylhydrolase, partial [Acidobacteria bacterium]|nr:family 10 glycosylhydrolase [Acidobacteriota bacterium]
MLSHRLRLAGALAVALSLFAVAAPNAVAPPATDVGDVRALWVTRATLTSPEAIARMVEAARAGGFNALLVQVRARGDAYYRSSLEPRAAELAGRPDFDPLDYTLAVAHRAGLSVHAWIAVNLVSSAATLP